MRRLSKFFLILFWLSLFCLTISAQELPNNSAANNLVLEVTFLKGNAPVFQKIGENSRVRSNTWYSLFQRVSNWQPKANELPVRAVKIAPYFEESSVKILVSVFTGERFFDKEVFVADISLHENERKVVGELTKFGVEPFELAVVQSVPTTIILPTVVNKTSSLQVMVEPDVSTLPGYKVKVFNTSNKPVIAYAYEMTADNRKLLSGMLQGRESKPMIAPNAIYEAGITSRTPPSNEPIRELTLVIQTVIFEDGSYEGESQRAAMFNAFVVGRRSLLKQVIPLWQKAFESKAPKESLANLSAQISALKETADESALTELIKQFPELTENEKDNLRTGVEVSMNVAKTDMLSELRKFSETPDLTDKAVQNWLKQTVERYQKWLMRLP